MTTFSNVDLNDPVYHQFGKLGKSRGGAQPHTQMPALNQEQRDVLVGTMLGDATMCLHKGKPKFSVKFEQCMEHQHYVFHLFDLFKPFVGTGPRIRIDKGVPKSLWFRTFRVDGFKFYWDLFHAAVLLSPSPGREVALPNKEELNQQAAPYSREEITNLKKLVQNQSKEKIVKVVPPNIEKYLTPRALAYWFMDDGTHSTNIKSSVRDYSLCTHAFTQSENKWLRDALKTNFRLVCGVHKDGLKWRLGIYRESSVLFESLIKPYLHNDFLYKIK